MVADAWLLIFPVDKIFSLALRDDPVRSFMMAIKKWRAAFPICNLHVDEKDGAGRMGFSHLT